MEISSATRTPTSNKLAPDISVYKCSSEECQVSKSIQNNEIVIELKRNENMDAFDDAKAKIEFAQWSPFEKDTIAARDTRGQLGSYMTAVSGSQFRFFGFCIFVFGTHARHLRWDVSGIIVSASFDYTSTNYLAEFLWRSNEMDDAQRGHDPSVTRIPADKAKKLASKADLAELERKGERHQYPMTPPHFVS